MVNEAFEKGNVFRGGRQEGIKIVEKNDRTRGISTVFVNTSGGWGAEGDRHNYKEKGVL
jgi:hypothetical protein